MRGADRNRPKTTQKAPLGPKKAPRVSTMRASVKDLLTTLAATHTMLRSENTKPAQTCMRIIENFQKQLADAMVESVVVAPKARPTKKRPALPEPAPHTSSTLATPGEERRRIYKLERVNGSVAKALVVQEQVDDSVSASDLDYRIGCLELLSDSPWSWLEGAAEGDAIRVFFPADEYENMPPHLDLERPRKPAVGQTWRLYRPDGSIASTFVLRSIEIVKGAVAPHWRYGDVVRAEYDGKEFVARFLRRSESGDAVVHWLIDDTYSTIPMIAILGPSTAKWTGTLEDADVEIKF